MPRGGRRANAGRKPGSKTATRSREIANEAVVRGARLPLEYMLAVLADENAPQARRDMMAVQAAPFCHPRLAAVSTSAVPGRDGGGGSNVSFDVQIFAVPRGALIDRSGLVTIEGEATELKPISPFEGSPPLGLSDQTQPAPLERLEVTEIDTTNVTVLRRRDDDGSTGAA